MTEKLKALQNFKGAICPYRRYTATNGGSLTKPLAIRVCATFLGFLNIAALAESPALTRDSGIATVQTFQGGTPAHLTPVTPGRNLTVLVLADTLNAEDAVRVRHEISAVFLTGFLSNHPVQLANVSGSGGDFSTPLTTALQLQTALKQISAGKTPPEPAALMETLGGIPSNLPGEWAQAIIIGRLPAFARDEAWVAGWLGELYRAHRVRVSFWSLDKSAPGWAQSMVAGAMGMVDTGNFNALLPMLNDNGSYVEVSWQTTLKKGGLAYTAELKNAAGERSGVAASLASAAGYTPALTRYLAARAELDKAPLSDEAAAEKVLSLNPADLDALHRVARQLTEEKKAKEAADSWRAITEIASLDGAAWAGLGQSEFAAEAFDEAGTALERAAQLGVKDPGTLEIQARLHMRRNDFRGALTPIDEALVTAGARQSLWLLRAECARSLKQQPKEIESLERAAALGEIPTLWGKDLIAVYLENGQAGKALPYLRKAKTNLPTDTAGLIEYARFWERAQQAKEAEELWQRAIAADNKSEAAYAGLIANYDAAQRYADAGEIADNGLRLLPKSVPLLVAKEQSLERAGDIYAARRFLTRHAGEASNLELLKRRAALEDVYGGAGADSYLALVKALSDGNAPQVEVVAACRRGLTVSLREERMDAAQGFAEKLAGAGDRSGLDLIAPRMAASSDRVEIPGGADAFQFLLFGHAHGKSEPARTLLAVAGLLANMSTPSAAKANAKTEWQILAGSVHQYFQTIASLDALGERKEHGYEIMLSLNDKPSKQRTEKVFEILGLKLHRDKEGVSVKSAEGKSQAKKQDVLAALSVDEQGIEEALDKHKTYIFEIPFDVIPVFPSEEFWRKGFYEKERLPGGLAEAFVTDIRLPRLYVALNGMDPSAAQALIRAVSPRGLIERDSNGLWLFSTALALNGNTAEVPGGDAARPVWAALAGADPATGAVFFQALLHKDDGRLMSFFYTLAQLDVEHQRFFTRSTARAKRFYELFRSSYEMRHGGDSRVMEAGFSQFLREVPLNDDLSVDFPGAPEVWMVAKGVKVSGGSVAKMTRNMKRKAAPDDEDQILIRLATTVYKTTGRPQTELANLVVVARIDAQRTEPLSPESALLLAQGYFTHEGLYPYFVQLGDLETADYQKLLSLETKCEGVDSVTANLRLGELHGFLAISGAARDSALVPAAAFLPLFRKALDRFMAAKDSAGFTNASLEFVSDLVPYAKQQSHSADSAIRQMLLGDAAASREKAFDQVIALQKVPSLDGLLAIEHGLQHMDGPIGVFDDMQRAVVGFTVLPLPKEWHLNSERKRSIDLYESAGALKTITKLRLSAAKHKRKEEELQKLAVELRGELEPWVELALVGRVYARYLDGSDLLVSDDAMLARKHEFVALGPHTGKLDWFEPANILISSASEGSYFVGGLAEFSLAAGRARASGIHASPELFAGALFASVRATDWRGFDASVLASFGATVRLAREWIVESASAPDMRAELNEAARGILSLARRKALINGVEQHDWNGIWQSVSVSDLHFVGDALSEHAPAPLWRSAQLQAMKKASQHATEPDMLGSVSPGLSGCAQPRLRRYEPYEEYQRYLMPNVLSERLAELKMNLAWLADNAAWEPERVIRLAEPAADDVLGKIKMHDSWDWSAAIDGYRNLKADDLELLLAAHE